MKQLHDIQIQILKNLLFSASLKYSQLKPNKELENNKFNFHLNRLIDCGYITKRNQYYELTNTGKEYANRIGTDTHLRLQGKISVVVIITRNKDTQTLIYTRLKHPFYGCQGHLSGKVYWGETLDDAAKRELKEETNLEGKPELFAITHEIVKDEKSLELLEDKYLYYFIVKNPKGELSFLEEGHFEWVKIKEIGSYIKKPFKSSGETKKYTKAGTEHKKGTVFFNETLTLTSYF